MKVLIIANFTRDFSETDNGRFLYLAKMLSGMGHDVELITNDFNHGKKERRGPISVQYPFKITLLHEPGYKKNVSIQRFYSHHIWGKNLDEYLKTIEKPDVVYCAVPSLTGPNYVADYCNRNGIRFVIDIQDLWPEAFQMVLKMPMISSLIFRPFKKAADRIYSKADGICAVSKTYVDRALRVNDKCLNGTTVYLGTSLDSFDEYSKEEAILRKPVGEVWIGYCGTLGSSYDLTCVFDGLAILKTEGICPKFIIMGNGPKENEFKEYAKHKELDVIFTGRIPYNQMCSLLCECDITINPISHLAAQSIINKHGDYASSGLPVISTQENEEYRDLVEEYNMGFNCRNNDPIDLAEKIAKLANEQGLRIEMGKNARRCAEERFDRKSSYKALIAAILESH